jgi:hypothetical protein
VEHGKLAPRGEEAVYIGTGMAFGRRAFLGYSSRTNRVYASYTATTQSTAPVVMTFTNFTGVVQSYTNIVLTTTNTVIPAATNQARRVFTFRVPASGTVTFTPNYAAGVTFGLQLSATGAGAYNASIQPTGVQ